tara:strand:- start:374542 stop:375108 length:567 start_codon:yes stop_codon:yes gene_type:complete
MIIKSISHTNRSAPQRLIRYVFDGRKSLLDPDGNQLVFKQHLRSYNKQRWISQFNELEKSRKSHYGSKSVVCYHEVLSFSDKSTGHLNRQIIKDLVCRYIDLRTQGDQLCIGACHFDAGKNWHVHLIFSGIRTRDQKSARISKARLAEIKEELQTYQITTYPQLEDSVVRNGLKKKDSFVPFPKKKPN